MAPSRAVYFCTYSQAKQFWNSVFPPDSPIVHVCSASCAGFTASTLTNPIWFVKTRLQLDVNKENRMTAIQCVRRIYRKSVSIVSTFVLLFTRKLITPIVKAYSMIGKMLAIQNSTQEKFSSHQFSKPHYICEIICY